MAILAGTVRRYTNNFQYREGGVAAFVPIYFRQRRLTAAEEIADPAMPNPLTEASLDLSTWDPVTLSRPAIYLQTLTPL